MIGQRPRRLQSGFHDDITLWFPFRKARWPFLDRIQSELVEKDSAQGYERARSEREEPICV